MESGLVDANLGGGLFKKRVARIGTGKSGGFRTLVAGVVGERWIYLYGFAKSERDNVDQNELRALKNIAAALLGLNPGALERALLEGTLQELKNGK